MNLTFLYFFSPIKFKTEYAESRIYRDLSLDIFFFFTLYKTYSEHLNILYVVSSSRRSQWDSILHTEYQENGVPNMLVSA